MNIALKILSGPLMGQIFTVEKGLSIGRQGDIVLEDPKVSGIHAHIAKSSSGRWVVTDNESKNGLRVKDIRVKAVTLKPGVIFDIGDSSFEVVPVDAPKDETAGMVRMPVPEKEKGADKEREPEKPKKKQRYWYEVLAEFLFNNKDSFKDKTIPLAPLEPALVLEFVRGVQMNSKWILGYGPRKFGPRCIDLPIWEPGAPEICFEIHPTSDGILFKTNHAGKVCVNNEAVDSRVLRMGDTISINETLIEVDFTE